MIARIGELVDLLLDVLAAVGLATETASSLFHPAPRILTGPHPSRYCCVAHMEYTCTHVRTYTLTLAQPRTFIGGVHVYAFTVREKARTDHRI